MQKSKNSKTIKNAKHKWLKFLAAVLGLAIANGSFMQTTIAANAGPAKKDFAPYMKLVQSKIKWTPPGKTTATSVSITFTVGKTGSISDVKVKEPSGDKIVDQLALDTIKKSAPFPPLPPVKTP